MRILLTPLLLLASVLLTAQPAEYLFGPGQFHHIAPSPDGNYFLLGSSSGTLNLKKIDPAGAVIWDHFYLPSVQETMEYGYRLVVLDNGNLLVTGMAKASIYAEPIGLAMLADGEGHTIWKYLFPEIRTFFDGLPSEDGFLLVGWFENDFYSDSPAIVRLNADGIEEWTKPFTGSSQIYPKRIFPTADGNFLLIGRTGSDGVSFRKIKPDGTKIWEVAGSGSFGDKGYYPFGYFLLALEAVQMPDGSVWVVNSYRDVSLAHYSAGGQLLESKFYGSKYYKEYPYSLTALADGGFLITGVAETYPPEEEELGFAIRIGENKMEKWRIYYGEPGRMDWLTSGIELPDGQFYLCGMNNDPPQAWLLRTDPEGNPFPWEVSGKVVFDLNGNCEDDPGEMRAAGWFLVADNGQTTQAVQTDQMGTFSYHTKDDTTTFTLLPGSPADAWTLCQNGLTVISHASNPQAELTFVVQPDDPWCPLPEVGLTQPDLVRCQNSRMFTTIMNRGTGPSDSLLLKIQLDGDLFLVSATEPWSQTGDIVEFEIAPMDGLSQKTIGLEVQLACDPQLGAVHPVTAEIGPIKCEPPWAGPRFAVNGRCEGNDVVFELFNEGGGGASAATTYRVFADALLAVDGVEVVLPEGEGSVELVFPADGRTWRVELAQASGFPGASRPAAVVEGCGTGSNGLHSIGLHDAFRPDDAGPDRSAIFPPNTLPLPDKITPSVRGFGRFNQMYDLEAYEFTARVRNPLADTVQEVVFLLDFLESLNETTFELLASNAPGETALTTDRDIRVVMHGLGLVPGSSAQIRFRIRPMADTPPDEGFYSHFLAMGRVFLDNYGPIELVDGYLNYSQALFPGETDEYNEYPPEALLFGGRHIDGAKCAALADDGSVFLGGGSYSYTDGAYYTGFVIKTDEEGKAHWLEAVGLDNSSSDVRGVVPLPDGGVMVAGTSVLLGLDGDYPDLTPYVARYDQFGKMLWYKKHRPAGAAYGAQVIGMLQSQDGKCVVFGLSENGGAIGIDQFYWKVDANGQTMWSTNQEMGGEYFTPWDGIALPGGGYIFMGYYDSWGSTTFDVLIQKVSAQGTIVWNKGYNGQQGFYPFGIALAEDGGFLVGGYSGWETSPDYYSWTPTFVKFNASGQAEWEKNPITGPLQDARVLCLAPDLDGGFIAGGEILADTTDHSYDMLLMKLDADGEVAGVKHFGAKNWEMAWELLLTDEGRVLLWGHNQGFAPAYNIQAVLVVTDTITATNELPLPVAGRTLVFPNPARNLANVVLSPPPTTPVPWQFFDLNGRMVESGVSETGLFSLSLHKLTAGMYFLVFPGSSYPGSRVVVVNSIF